MKEWHLYPRKEYRDPRVPISSYPTTNNNKLYPRQLSLP